MNIRTKCGGLLAAANLIVEKWSNGDLAIPVAVGDGVWRIFVTFEEQWIRLSAAVTPLAKSEGAATLSLLLRLNCRDTRVRTAITEENIVVQCDYPILDFSDKDFVAAVAEVESAARSLIVLLQVSDPPKEGDVHG